MTREQPDQAVKPAEQHLSTAPEADSLHRERQGALRSADSPLDADWHMWLRHCQPRL